MTEPEMLDKAPSNFGKPCLNCHKPMHAHEDETGYCVNSTRQYDYACYLLDNAINPKTFEVNSDH